MPFPIENKISAMDFMQMDLPERCELINGEIILPDTSVYDPSKNSPVAMSPAPNQLHQEISACMLSKIYDYIHSHKGKCKVFPAPSDVKLDEYTIVQPDLYVTCSPDKLDGQYHNGAPDWVIEILSPSTAHHDTNIKLQLYKSHGVKEYWIVDPVNRWTIVYLFDSNDATLSFHSFEDMITVNIYKDFEEPLSIRFTDYF